MMNRIYLILLFAFILSSVSSQSTMIKGVSFEGSPKEITAMAIDPVVAIHANWAAVMPFGYTKTLDAPKVITDLKNQWWGESPRGVKKTIQLFNEKGIQVMIKPQIWVWNGEFTGHIKMNSEEDWIAFEKSYEAFIMTYVHLANELDVPMLCLGTELHTFVQSRSSFWKQMIINIRKIYKGKITYAENWDQFEKVPFWDQLDFIGIDAYFPLSNSKTPTVEEIRLGWQSPKKKIIALQKKVSKQVLFTEYGYRSLHFTAKEPWSSHKVSDEVDHKAQRNTLEGLYLEFWKEHWFSGGFLWKWHNNNATVGGYKDNRFTVQNKPAEKYVRSFYKKNN